MMGNPYEILGVSQNASDEDIKRAYRALSRKYHPDANINNPNREQAEERFKEIQQAYNQIMQERQQGYSGYDYGGARSGYGGFTGGAYRTRREETPQMQAAANYLANRYYKEAWNILNGMNERSARWYYYSAVAQAGLGNNMTAREYAEQAVQMEPTNMEYRQLVQQLSLGGNWYSSMGQGYGRPYEGFDRFCMSMVLMNLCCNCCCWPGM